jgi:hypothetical protein
MQLVLRIGYPFPYPKQQTYDEIEADADAAHLATGWTKRSHHVLEAQTRAGDGYAHPAIVANRHVYCGFNLIED